MDNVNGGECLRHTENPHSRQAYQKVKARAKARSAAVTLAGQDIGGQARSTRSGQAPRRAQGEPPIADRVRHGRASHRRPSAEICLAI